MFGSTAPCGQSPTSPFGSPSVFWQMNNPGTNPFALKPFGSSNPFGLQTESSMSGTSTSVFGQSSNEPAFGASSSPAFGSCSSCFGGNSVFGQKTTFGGFGSTPNQSSPLGSTFQQTQSAFGSIPFGFTAFGTSSQPSFGASSTPAFGSSITPAFGVTSTPAFGPAFGSTSTPAFSSIPSPLLGNTGTTFGVSGAPAFGSTTTPAFGAQSTSLFGSSSTPAFGAASTPAFGSSSTSAFGASNTASFSFGSTSSTGQTTFRTTPSTFVAQSSAFGGANFSGQPTSSVSSPTPAQANPFGSRSTFGQPPANPAQANPFGSRSTSGQPAVPTNPFDPRSTFGQPSAPTNPFGFKSTFGQPSASTFSSATSSNPFDPKTQSFSSSVIGTSSPSPFSLTFGSSPSKLFSSTSSTASLLGGASNTAFGSSSSSIFSGMTSAFSSPSTFGSSTGSSSTFSSGMNFDSTQSSGLFQSSTLSMGRTPSPFSQPPHFQQTVPAFGSNLFSAASTGCGGNLLSSSAAVSSLSNPDDFGQAAPSLSTTFQPSVPAQTSSAFSSSNFGQMQPVSTTESGQAKERNNALSSSLSLPSSSSSTAERVDGVARIKDNHAEKETDFSDTEKSDHKVHGAAAAVLCESRARIETLLPKLHHADYYTEPGIQELASKEQAEPGFCCRVKDFVVGRHGFGSIKFSGETDVRSIDLESIVEFNNREVIVYKEGSKKPRVGQGLNKPAEVTLLNIKCIDKSTGVQYTEGPKVEMYKEMLIKKAKKQGAEFVSYDAVRGEWKFSVKHFSSYEFGDSDTDVSFF